VLADEGRAYAEFVSAVALTHLDEWLGQAEAGGRVLDLGGRIPGTATRAAAAGHAVVAVGCGPTGPRVQRVLADIRNPDWLQPASVDTVLAEGGVLSDCLAIEETLTLLRRGLRPGGRLLMAVDSLVAGLSALAENGRWAELADTPNADMLLVPDDLSGGVTRAFWAGEVVECLESSGFAVEWIRPRTVLPPETVLRAVRTGASREPLVRAELQLERERPGETLGQTLVASARRA
jgi:hypothetical protein